MTTPRLARAYGETRLRLLNREIGPAARGTAVADLVAPWMDWHVAAASPEPEEKARRQLSSKPRPVRKPSKVHPRCSPGKYAPPKPIARVVRICRPIANVSTGVVNWTG